MWLKATLASVVALGVVGFGCKGEEQKPAPGPVPSPKMTTPAPATPTGEPAAAPAVPGAAGGASPAAAPGAGVPGMAAATGAMDAVTKEAQAKLDQVMTYIKENKLEAAETALKQVEGMKDKLPASIQPQVANARTLLDKAKAAAGAGGAMPAAPAVPDTAK